MRLVLGLAISVAALIWIASVQDNGSRRSSEGGPIEASGTPAIAEQSPEADCDYYYPKPDSEGRRAPEAAVILGPAHPCYGG